MERRKHYRWTGDEPLWLVIFMKGLHIVTALSLVAFIWACFAVFYLNTDPWRIPSQALLRLDRWWYDTPPRAITKAELRKHDGKNPDEPVWLAFNGKVYDVTKGKKHYTAGGGYEFFSGRDASRAFLTGCFKEECLVSDLTNLTPEQEEGVKHWDDFYKKTYHYLGPLVD